MPNENKSSTTDRNIAHSDVAYIRVYIQRDNGDSGVQRIGLLAVSKIGRAGPVDTGDSDSARGGSGVETCCAKSEEKGRTAEEKIGGGRGRGTGRGEGRGESAGGRVRGGGKRGMRGGS